MVNTKTTIPFRVGEERWLYTSTLRVYIHHYSPPFRGIVVHIILSLAEANHAYLDLKARNDGIFRQKAQRHNSFDFSPRFRNLGRVNHLLVFAFNGFEIGRYITADVRDPQQAILKPSTPYQRAYSQTKQAQQKVANGFSGDDAIIPGEKTIRYKVNEITNLLFEGVLLHLNYLSRKLK